MRALAYCSSSSMHVPQRLAAWRARLQGASPLSAQQQLHHHRRRRATTAAATTATTTTGAPAPPSAAAPPPTPIFPHPITYHPDFTINPIPDGHRFPMPKDALLHQRLRQAGAARFFEPRPADRDSLLLAHDAAYVDSFLDGTLDPKQMRRIGLPWSPELVRRTLVGVGSAVLAARLAAQLGLAVTTNGGTHHAHRGYGSGFCVFNDLAVAARQAQADGLVERCFFVDLDVHQGDGSASIFKKDASVYTLSVHCAEQAFPEPFPGDMDVGLAAGTGDDEYLAALDAALERAWREFEGQGGGGGGSGGGNDDGGPAAATTATTPSAAAAPVLALYNAGVDVHKDDDLGKLALTDAGIAARDRRVLEFFAARGVPLCAAIGGGYNLRDHSAIVDRHMHLHRCAGEMYGRFAAAADARRAAAMAARARARAAQSGA